MYYVILKQPNNPRSNFFGFLAEKYIAAEKTNNVIFEVTRNGKMIRKWIDKKEIILLTDDKNYFVELMHHFKEIEAQEQKLVDEAQRNLEESLTHFTEAINQEIDAFEIVRESGQVPCLLKGI